MSFISPKEVGRHRQTEKKIGTEREERRKREGERVYVCVKEREKGAGEDEFMCLSGWGEEGMHAGESKRELCRC